MQKEKKYVIQGICFRLRTDLTLDESTDMDAITARSVDPVPMTKEELYNNTRRYLEIALEPVGKKTVDDLNIGGLKDSEINSVTKDFFTARIKARNEALSFFANSMRDSGMQATDTTK